MNARKSRTSPDVAIQDYLYRNTSSHHDSIIEREQNITIPENETGVQKNKRLKKVAALLKQCKRRAWVVEALGPVGFICSRWIPSRWITHTRNYIWKTTITPFLKQQRDWSEQQFEEFLQIPIENMLDVLKSKNIVASFSDVDRYLLPISNLKSAALIRNVTHGVKVFKKEIWELAMYLGIRTVVFRLNDVM
jgi:hypothetical protein